MISNNTDKWRAFNGINWKILSNASPLDEIDRFKYLLTLILKSYSTNGIFYQIDIV